MVVLRVNKLAVCLEMAGGKIQISGIPTLGPQDWIGEHGLYPFFPIAHPCIMPVRGFTNGANRTLSRLLI